MSLGKLNILIILIIFLTGSLFATEESRIEYVSAGAWYPIAYPDKTGVCGQKGLFVDVMEIIFIDNLKLKLHCAIYPWKRAQHRVEVGQSDLLITVPTEARRKYGLVSKKPILKLYMHIYTYVGHPKLEQIKKIKKVTDIKDLDLVAVTNLGNGWHKENIDAYGVKTVYAPKDQNIANILAYKRADIMIDAAITMNHIIKELGVVSKLVLTDVKFGPVNFHVVIGKKSKFAHKMKKVDRIIKEMIRSGQLQKMIDPYEKL